MTATSPINVIVDANARPPFITSVGPLLTKAGDAVTVGGESLSPVLNQTAIRLNQKPAAATIVTNTQLVFPVPPNTGSGKVTVITPYGVAVSSQAILVAPAGVVPADIVQAQQLTLDDPAQAFSVATTINNVGSNSIRVYSYPEVM